MRNSNGWSSVVALLLVACSHAKETRAVAPVPASTAAPAAGAANMQHAPANPPNTPTASNVVIAEEVRRACNIPDEDAYFEFDSSRLTTVDQGALDQVSVCFTRGPMAGRRLRLVGHADPRGTSEYNMTLGQSRADAVGIYLDVRGMDKGKTQSTSRGAMDAQGTDESSWQRDRRVDVVLGN